MDDDQNRVIFYEMNQSIVWSFDTKCQPNRGLEKNVNKLIDFHWTFTSIFVVN